jgi:hypothetical protein
MGTSSAWIAGSYQSDFARNYAREGLEISDMVAEAVTGTLRSAGLEPEDVESIHVGNAFGQLFTGQGQLGAMPATVEPRLWGKPAARHEAACAWTTRWRRPAAGRSAQVASPPTTTTTRSSRAGCGAPTALRSPTGWPACCWSPIVTGPNGSAENHRPGSPAGGTARPG